MEHKSAKPSQAAYKLKLSLLLGVPIAALMFFSSVLISEKRTVSLEMGKLDEASHLIRQSSGLVHEMQRERGYTSGFIFSKGMLFKAELMKQRTATDEQYLRFMTSYSSIKRDAAYSLMIKNLDLAIAEWEKLKGIRAEVDSLRNGYFDAIAYYSGINSLVLDIIPIISQLSADREISSLYLAYYHLQQIKENAGMQRAALIYAFGLGKFPPGQYGMLAGVAKNETNSLKRFLLLAPPDIKEIYLKDAAMPEVAQADGMRNIAIEKGVEGNFGIDASHWAAMQTVKIDKINDVCNLLDEKIRKMVDSRNAEAETGLRIYLLVNFAVIAFVLLMGALLFRIILRSREMEEDSAVYAKALENTKGKLEETIALTGAVSNVSPVGQVVADSAGMIISVNPAAERMFGYSGGEMIGKSVKALAPTFKEDEYSKYIQDYLNFKKTGLPEKRNTIRTPEEVIAVKKSGEIFHNSLFVKEVHLTGKDVFVGIMEDITERRKAKIALTEAMENSDAIMNASNETLALIGLEGNILAINEAGAKRLHACRADLVGKLLFQILPLGLAMNRIKQFEEVARTGKPLTFEDERAGRFFSNSLFPVLDKNAQVTRFALFAVDITERKLDEERLRHSEEQFRSVFQQAGVGVAIIDSATGRFLRVNGKYSEIAGLSIEEMLSSNFLKITHPDDLRADLDNMEKLKKGLISGYSMEKRYVRKDGAIVWVTLTVSPLWLGKSELHEHIAIVQDITDRKNAEDALRKIMENFAEAQRIAHMGSWEMDLATYKSSWSDETFRMFGFEPGEIVPSFENFLNCVHPDDRKAVMKNLEAVLNGGELPVMEHRIVRKDGVERTLKAQGKVVRDGAGMPVRVVGTELDITEHKKTEAEIVNANRRYTSLIDNIRITVYLLSPSGHLTFISKPVEWLTGRPPEDFLDKRVLWEDVLVADDRGKYNDFRQSIFSNISANSLQYRVKRTDGTIAWVFDQCLPLLDDGGDVACFQGTIGDLTKLKEMEQMKENFYHAVVHDLKSPITGIQLELNMLSNQIASFSAECSTKEPCQRTFSGYEASLKQKVADVGEGLGQLYLMILSLLKLGEIEEEKLELHYEPFAMGDLFGELERDFRGRASAKKVAIEFRSAFAGTVIADFKLLKRVLQNLIDNALKYCIANTTITVDAVCTKKGEGYENIIISVTNTGQPLTENKINALFQKFKTLGHAESGSGIGLFFCYKTMDKLGGGIYVDQDANAITFHIFFPNG